MGDDPPSTNAGIRNRRALGGVFACSASTQVWNPTYAPRVLSCPRQDINCFCPCTRTSSRQSALCSTFHRCELFSLRHLHRTRSSRSLFPALSSHSKVHCHWTNRQCGNQHQAPKPSLERMRHSPVCNWTNPDHHELAFQVSSACGSAAEELGDAVIGPTSREIWEIYWLSDRDCIFRIPRGYCMHEPADDMRAGMQRDRGLTLMLQADGRIAAIKRG